MNIAEIEFVNEVADSMSRVISALHEYVTLFTSDDEAAENLVEEILEALEDGTDRLPN